MSDILKRRKACAAYFNLHLHDVKHDKDGYDDEYTIFDQNLEVVTLTAAIENELDLMGAQGLLEYMTQKQIGIYRYMDCSGYLFRWL